MDGTVEQLRGPVQSIFILIVSWISPTFPVRVWVASRSFVYFLLTVC